jgi:dGTPase
VSVTQPMLISPWRFRVTSQSGRTIAVEASSDRSRIVFSEAFRQLHRKAQVFSLDDAGSARTRLTHSLEVAQIGRYLTQAFFEAADPSVLSKYDLQGSGDIVQSFVESACLVHDIGNPPFGHFGEVAIRHWFERKMDDLERAWCDGSQTRSMHLHR